MKLLTTIGAATKKLITDFPRAAAEATVRHAAAVGLMTCGIAAGALLENGHLGVAVAAGSAGAVGFFLSQWEKDFDVVLTVVLSAFSLVIGVVCGCAGGLTASFVAEHAFSPVLAAADNAAWERAVDDVTGHCGTLKPGLIGQGEGFDWKVTHRRYVVETNEDGIDREDETFEVSIQHDYVYPLRAGQRPQVRHDRADVTFTRRPEGICLPKPTPKDVKP
jgi:hypothetical protein